MIVLQKAARKFAKLFRPANTETATLTHYLEFSSVQNFHVFKTCLVYSKLEFSSVHKFQGSRIHRNICVESSSTVHVL